VGINYQQEKTLTRSVHCFAGLIEAPLPLNGSSLPMPLRQALHGWPIFEQEMMGWAAVPRLRSKPELRPKLRRKGETLRSYSLWDLYLQMHQVLPPLQKSVHALENGCLSSVLWTRARLSVSKVAASPLPGLAPAPPTHMPPPFPLHAGCAITFGP
jgi:hypothetical protein